jgi:hypothetical protein
MPSCDLSRVSPESGPPRIPPADERLLAELLSRWRPVRPDLFVRLRPRMEEKPDAAY